MTQPRFHLAQVNIALARDDMESELLADFVAALDPVNAHADAAAGFVWRLQTDEGNATSIRAFDDPLMIVNMSVWESLEALREFVYGDPAHLSIMRGRRRWFHPMKLYLALWWVPAGHRPTVEEARARLAMLEARGPSPEAFTFREHFPSPDSPESDAPITDPRDLCPA